VRCVDYASYGTQELSRLVVAGLEGRDGVLLANHGAIVTGADLRRALWRAVELEALARVYYLASLAGDPVILSDDEIMRTVERFKNYGPRAG
jgi:L-fuculose-phosphate aldolase